MCLSDKDYSVASCCDPNGPATCTATFGTKYCTNYAKGQINNPVLKNWFCP